MMSGQENGYKRRPQQLSLFDAPTLNVTREIKEAMNAGAKCCGLSRDEIVDLMNDLAAKYGVSLVSGNGKGLTIDTFEKWINPQDLSRQMPIKALPVFCAVVGDASALDVLARPLGYEVIGEDDQLLLKWAKANLNARDARKTMRRIEGDLGIL